MASRELDAKIAIIAKDLSAGAFASAARRSKQLEAQL